MLTLKRVALISMAVVAAATSPALAGTKYAANLVSNSVVDPPPNPTLSPKSSMKLSDKGSIAIALAGVTDGSGALVTTSTVYADSVKLKQPPALDGSEYIVIITLFIPAVAEAAPVIEVPIPVDLKGGKGKTKLSVAGLLGLIGPGIGRSIEIRGAEVWGPLGTTGGEPGNCLAVLQGPAPVGLPLGATCRGGTQFGISGLSVPLP